MTLNYCDYSNAEGDIFTDYDSTVTPDENCITVDPLFVGGEPFDSHLQADSPAIDAGSNDLMPPDVTTDLDGNLRIFGVGDIVDIGAYEFQVVTFESAMEAVDKFYDKGLITTWGTANSLNQHLEIAQRKDEEGKYDIVIKQLDAFGTVLDAQKGISIVLKAHQFLLAAQGKLRKPYEKKPELIVALTFDDGPHALGDMKRNRTNIVIEALNAKGVKGTFFVDKKRIKSKAGKDMVAKMGKDCHQIGIHGIDPDNHHGRHEDFVDWNKREQKWDFTRLNERILDMVKEIKDIFEEHDPPIKKDIKYVRPPGGGSTVYVRMVKRIDKMIEDCHINAPDDVKEDDEKRKAMAKKLAKKFLEELDAHYESKEKNLKRYTGDGTYGLNSWWGEPYGREDFWTWVGDKITEAKKRAKDCKGPAKMVVLLHDIRKKDHKEIKKLIDRIRKEAKGVKVRFVTLGQLVTDP